MTFKKTCSYEGQSGNGYGGIDDCSKYLQDRYGGIVTLSSSKSLEMAAFMQSEWDDKNNCTLTAITRILYYYSWNGYEKIPCNIDEIYARVKAVVNGYGYTNEKGTSPTKINNVVNDLLDHYGYGQSKCKGVYVWNFENHVKKEIDADRPVIMNLARGYYGDHTVTVCGYKIYKGDKTYEMIEVYDGWSQSKRYIDYSAFAYDFISSGFGSFNTITMEKGCI